MSAKNMRGGDLKKNMIMLTMMLKVMTVRMMAMMMPTVISRRSIQATSRSAAGQPSPPGFTFKDNSDDNDDVYDDVSYNDDNDDVYDEY